MSTTELENWLAKVKDFSVSELLTVQEKIVQELKLKTEGSQNSHTAAKTESQADFVNPAKDITPVTDADLPPDLIEELAAMNSYSDKALWKAARSHLSAKEAQKLRQLNHKQQKYGRTSLSLQELQILEELGDQYDRSVLLRSQALLLLKERGHDISKILKAS